MDLSRAWMVPGIATGLALVVPACADNPVSQDDQAKAAVKSHIAVELGHLADAAVALQAAAPAPDADGWNETNDATAVAAMRAAWKDARTAFEHIEGPIVLLFPNYDMSTDERYDGFLANGPDDDLFDGMGVTGIHAIERILWANSAPDDVITFEMSLPGYQKAQFPATMTEADEFKNELAARLVSDTAAMKARFPPLPLDTATAFRGVIESMSEQIDKITLAATGQEESRYAQYTLADMRANLDGGRTTYNAFSSWLKGLAGGPALDASIQTGFDRVLTLYNSCNQGESLPPSPPGFDPAAPTPADLATPYGRIFAGLTMETNSSDPDSLVSAMNAAADRLRIPILPPH